MALRIGIIAAVVVVFLLIYILYALGYTTLKAKKSIVFVGNGIGKKQGSASFRVCEGYIKRVIRFEENRTYKFDFQPDLKKGDVSVRLKNGKNETLLELNEERKKGTVKVESGEKYILTIDFHQATGSYKLEWS